jgi:hypothetical protein
MSKAVTFLFSLNSIVAPIAAAGFLVGATPALAITQEVPCYVIEIVCLRKDPTNCMISEPLPDPDCDGVPG